MFHAVFTRTMANARRIVDDEGFDLHPYRKRERLIMLARRWQGEMEARERAGEAMRAAIETAKRKHRRTRPYEPGNHGSNPHEIIAMVAAWHVGVGERDILSNSRSKNVVAARHDAVAAVYQVCKINGRKYSLAELGRLFGRDHTSMLHALRKRGLK